MRNDILGLAGLVVVAIVISTLIFGTDPFASEKGPHARKVDYSEFLKDVRNNKIERVVFVGDKLVGTPLSHAEDKPVELIVALSPETDNSDLITLLLDHNVQIEKQEEETDSVLMQIFISWFPMILLIGVWIFFMHQMQNPGGGRGAMGFGKSKAKLMKEDQVKTTFADVAGVEEAKEDVVELVEFLKDPDRFKELGGRIPTGVLMIGPAGVGKTLLARAIAGEAKVPFFACSGSEFVEMFVGVGASRIRDTFEQAKKSAPCIVFIDEIDAVGRHRGAGLGGGHDEREQTLNQLLVEMDGFEQNEAVIIIAATNRPDILDPALLRPGRFDRHVQVNLPTVKGREDILKVHMKKLPRLNPNANAGIIARGTPGFSGADLANLVNEAALFASRLGKKIVSMEEFELAKDKIMLGAERRSLIMDESEKRITAYHEAGHCIVGQTVPSHDPVHKVTIIPRGRALGVTFFLPERDEYGQSKEKLKSMLATAYGGRVAEEIIFGPEKITTGASNDIKKATAIARRMVTEWGLSDVLGPIAYSGDEREVFVGRSITEQNNISDDKAALIDSEVEAYVNEAVSTAKRVLNEKINILHNMAEALLEHETIEVEQIADLMLGNKAGPIEQYRSTSGATHEGEIADENTIQNLGLGFGFARGKPNNTSERRIP